MNKLTLKEKINKSWMPINLWQTNDIRTEIEWTSSLPPWQQWSTSTRITPANRPGKSIPKTNEEILGAMDIKDIEKFLRKKKLEKIDKK